MNRSVNVMSATDRDTPDMPGRSDTTFALSGVSRHLALAAANFCHSGQGVIPISSQSCIKTDQPLRGEQNYKLNIEPFCYLKCIIRKIVLC
jgi:hypothetical protein